MHNLNIAIKILESFLDNGGKKPCQQRTRQFQAWISVDFNQARFIVFINHEIHAQQLKIILFSFFIER